MTHNDTGHYAKKHPEGRKVDPRLAELLKGRASNGELPCAVAFDIAAHLDTTPAEVGVAMDLLEIRIVKCQMGLFGYRPRKSILKPPDRVPEALQEAIHESAAKEGRLSCKAAWDIAHRLKVGKMAVAAACETLGVKISACQLGAF